MAWVVCTPVSAADRPPNVVLILGDDQAWSDYGFMGHKEIRTPHLDRLASEGAFFTRGYAPVSVCRPSLASIVTGRHPHEHRMGIGLDGLGGNAKFITQQFSKYPTLPQLLGKAGYASFQAGKWCESGYALGGFTSGMSSGKPVPGSVGADGLGPLDKGLFFFAGGEGLRIGRETMAPVLSFIRENRQRPFFLWYAPMMPHVPHNPPAKLLEKYKSAGRPERIAKYMAMCEWYDQTVGQVLDELDKQGLRENTVVAFITDNGYVPSPKLDDMFDPRSKLSPYDAGLRSPIVVRWPGHIKPTRDDRPVQGIDLMPTILDACGISGPSDLPGVNLLELLAGKTKPREAIFGATFRRKATNPKDPAETMDFRWAVSGKWKLILPADAAANPELYDVLNDPWERENLAGDNAAVIADLTEKLDRWWSGRPASFGR